MNKKQLDILRKTTDALEQLRVEIDNIQAEKQEQYDAMSEKWQNSDKGLLAQEMVDNLSNASDSIGDAIDTIGAVIDGAEL